MRRRRDSTTPPPGQPPPTPFASGLPTRHGAARARALVAICGSAVVPLSLAATNCGREAAGSPVPLRPGPPAPSTSVVAPVGSFEGRALLVLSDVDMPASAFVDGRLDVGRPVEPPSGDRLTALPLPLAMGAPLRSVGEPPQAGVSNSVIGPPFGLDVSGDGRFAYVLETRGSPPPGTAAVRNVFTDLPLESHVQVVDLSAPGAPRVVQSAVVGRLTHTLDLHPDGSLIAVNTDEPGRTIVLFEVNAEGGIGREALATGVEHQGSPVRRVGRVQWHPSGRFLSLGLSFENKIAFFRLERDGAGGVSLKPFGPQVAVGKFPDEGAFTPDGRFYLSTDLQWGDDVPGLFVDPPPGTVSVVRFDEERGAHEVVGRAPTDVSPEGIAVSPDGRLVVTGNLRRSATPWGDSRLTPSGSLDLLQLNPETGNLTHLSNHRIDATLPEGVSFDRSGRFVAVTAFDYVDPRARRSAVHFWSVKDDDGRPTLEPTGVQVSVAAGAHTLRLVE